MNTNEDNDWKSGTQGVFVCGNIHKSRTRENVKRNGKCRKEIGSTVASKIQLDDLKEINDKLKEEYERILMSLGIRFTNFQERITANWIRISRWC